MSSAAEMMFEVGALTTMTPAEVAAGTSDIVESDAGTGDDLETLRRTDRLAST
ncbi:hypothetical protein [Brevibacterium sp. UCMA 11754]|uniref:hypothetical protein n=1 Tax=Brevibacterium sp. UCMA 11754 TaxID=2749198 RepID=UPI001F350093